MIGQERGRRCMADHVTTLPSAFSGASGQPTGQPGTEAPSIDFLEHWKAGIRELKTFRGHSHGVWAVAYAPDGLTLASGGVDRYVRIWDIETGTPSAIPQRAHCTTSVRSSSLQTAGISRPEVRTAPSVSGTRRPANRSNCFSRDMTTMCAVFHLSPTASCWHAEATIKILKSGKSPPAPSS